MTALLEPYIQGWMPPNRENWELILKIWQWSFPIFGSLQWFIRWYGMGKTSVSSIFNLPGRIAWLTMESPGFITLIYIMRTLPVQHALASGVKAEEIDIDLPWQNKVLAGLFVIHYAYRAVAFPFLQPSIAPMHVLVWLSAICFQLLNATCLGGWLAAYGTMTEQGWHDTVPLAQFALGLLVFYVGLASNYFHDEELREIRRRGIARREKDGDGDADANGSGGEGTKEKNHYSIPQAGLFRYMLYPHYLCEWFEWLGFWTACGFGCAPARAFFFNEIFVMLPRAVNGRRWYIETFGEDRIGKRYAVIPGLI